MSKRTQVDPVEEMSLPDANTFIADVMAYKAIYVLCSYRNGVLKASHLTCCLTLGKQPVWGVWTIGGKFLRFYGNRVSIEQAYASLTWRRKSASFALAKVSDIDIGGRRKELEKRYAQQIPDPEFVTQEGMVVPVAANAKPRRRARVAA